MTRSSADPGRQPEPPPEPPAGHHVGRSNTTSTRCRAECLRRRVYLKYLTPDEYSHVRDHLNETILPLHVAISGVFPILDDTFVEVSGGEVPVLPGLFVQAEEWTELERAQGTAPFGP